MAALDYLFQGSPPPAVTTTSGGTNGLPDWYQQYINGVAGKAVDIAGQDRPVPQQSVAGFNHDDELAAGAVRNSTGAWQPGMDAAMQTSGSALPAVGAAAGAANAAVAGPAQTWTSNYKEYMSPYTQSVVDNIGRLGMRNFNENIMPGIEGSMIGSGNWGSTRNADAIARAGRDAAADITGQQAQALESGYNTGAGIFATDANRQQQQQQMQAGTAITGANALAGATTTAAQQQGALTQAGQQLRLGDAQSLAAIGQTQRQMAQTGMDTAYANQVNTNNFDWDQLNKVNSTVRGMQLPTNPVQASNGPAAAYQPGALQSVGAAYGMVRGS